MKPFIIFRPLKEKKSLKIGIIAGIFISIFYIIFSVLIPTSLIVFSAVPSAPLVDLISFALLKSFSVFTLADWLVLFLFPIIGGLLFANYQYYKCKSSPTATAGLIGGIFAATCPACILPVLGAAFLTTAAFNASWIIKISALVLLISSTYYVAYKQQKCEVGK